MTALPPAMRPPRSPLCSASTSHMPAVISERFTAVLVLLIPLWGAEISRTVAARLQGCPQAGQCSSSHTGGCCPPGLGTPCSLTTPPGFTPSTSQCGNDGFLEIYPCKAITKHHLPQFLSQNKTAPTWRLPLSKPAWVNIRAPSFLYTGWGTFRPPPSRASFQQRCGCTLELLLLGNRTHFRIR